MARSSPVVEFGPFMSQAASVPLPCVLQKQRLTESNKKYGGLCHVLKLENLLVDPRYQDFSLPGTFAPRSEGVGTFATRNESPGTFAPRNEMFPGTFVPGSQFTF